MDILGFEKLIYHHDRIRKIGNDTPQFPVHATVSLGNYCNHACLWCTAFAYQQDEVRKVDQDKLLGFLGRAARRGLKALGYVGNGEPTAYPGFGRLVTDVASLGIEQGMFTNGYLLDRFHDEVLRHFTYVRISLDAGSSEMHDKMHDVSGHFDRIVRNIRNLASARSGSTPTIGVQFAAHHRNLGDLHRAAEVAQEAGADYFSVKPVFNRGSVGERIEKNRLTFEDIAPAVAKVRQELETRAFRIYFRPFQILSEEEDRNVLPYDRCVAGFFNINVYEDGSLIYCGPNRIPVGRIDDDLDIVEERISALSKKLDLSKCPGGCRYHPLNHLVDTVLKPDGARTYHANFL
jgi:cyclic pyranopterin phosphate synthase